MFSRLLPLVVLLFLPGCINVNVHATVDVNVKVDKALGDFFGDLDKKSATLTPTSAKP